MSVIWFDAVVILMVGFVPLISVVAIFNLVLLGTGARRTNRRLRQVPGASAGHVRDTVSLFAQLALAGVVALVAGFLVNISASYCFLNGQFVWPSSDVPYLLFEVACGLVLSAGGVLTLWVSRPDADWIRNATTLRATLREMSRAPSSVSLTLDELERRYQELERGTTVFGLGTPDWLLRHGFHSTLAEAEWTRGPGRDPVEWPRRIGEDLTWKQSVRWLLRRHWLGLAVQFLWPVAAVALVCLPLTTTQVTKLGQFLGGGAVLTVMLLALAAVPAVRGARCELVLVNRLVALERATLRECGLLLVRLRSDDAMPARQSPPGMRRVLAIGGWSLWRREASYAVG